METLSRREEEVLRKSLKSDALKTCDPVVRDFAQCTEGRTVSIVWTCRKPLRAMQDCLRIHMSQDVVDQAKVDFLARRKASAQGAQPVISQAQMPSA
ncbi:uncharacterized protein L969DRAFT_91767 [Mixia osmundae IAM 14324]|uniref:COX assembly mitochondrial protein n=1 Tax=Mixia osmundae (strain CBS 9802 / IAM 14324 / JCM 22182 / KY 12970) TaxID=764103 RepID=G7EAG6_MIXOS|nr:uncharacterized protein L969DRAFT_91767 [Mixia osmundae IAM 14324]KEI42316.1 hypothetical protein L969DRAFT_91767 [Mixia osmundae IAM 14324]GAA99826.1 hypothetical protein E5Q_06529 [Mixia osmundae IAM 14324]